jgi:hypothetical protein
MVTPGYRSRSSLKRGGVTLELAAACVVIGIPLLVALTQLARLDLASRRLQFDAQQSCIQSAMTGNVIPGFRLIPVVSSVRVSTGSEWNRLPGVSECSVTLKRRYWIGTGSGYGDR